MESSVVFQNIGTELLHQLKGFRIEFTEFKDELRGYLAQGGLDGKLMVSPRRKQDVDKINTAMMLSTQAPWQRGESNKSTKSNKSNTRKSTISNESNEIENPLLKHWPSDVKIRRGLEREKDPQLSGSALMKFQMSRHLTASERCSLRKSHAEIWVCDPTSNLLIPFEVVGLMLWAYDIVTAPYYLAFQVAVSDSEHLIAMFSLSYWLVRLLVSLRTGTYEQGFLVTTTRTVTVAYLKSWFLFDSAMIAFEAAGVIERYIARNRGFLCIFQTLRLFRILQSALLARIWDIAFAGKSNRQIDLLTKLWKVLLTFVILTHCFSCIWYAIGSQAPSDIGGGHWPLLLRKIIQDSGGGDAVELPAMYVYLTAFHWAIAQETLGAIEVFPVTSNERLFCVLLLTFGMLFSSTIVAIISSETMDYVMSQQQQKNMVQSVRRFMAQNAVHRALAARVEQQATERLIQKASLLSECDVSVLPMLSSTLRTELLEEIRLPHLQTHAVFHMWRELDMSALEELCAQAVRFSAFVPQDIVFSPCLTAVFVYFPTRGKFRYSQDTGTSKVEEDCVTTVNTNNWVCEAALWSQWVHVGRLEADITSEIMTLSIDNFFSLLPQHRAIAEMTRFYGRSFFLRIISAVPPHSEYPSDLKVPSTDPSDLMSAEIGLKLLRRERRKGNLVIADEDYDKLEAEVKQEKCAIVESEGQLQRIVAVLALKLETPDGRVLVRVGKGNNGRIKKAECTLPGTKRGRGEMPHVSLDTFLNEHPMNMFKAGIELVCSETEIEVAESANFGIQTKYLRTIQRARLAECFELPLFPLAFVANDREPEPISAQKTGLSKNLYIEPDSQEVFVMSDNKEATKMSLYAWLPWDSYDKFKSKEHADALEHWLGVYEYNHEECVKSFVEGIQSETILMADNQGGQGDIVI